LSGTPRPVNLGNEKLSSMPPRGVASTSTRTSARPTSRLRCFVVGGIRCLVCDDERSSASSMSEPSELDSVRVAPTCAMVLFRCRSRTGTSCCRWLVSVVAVVVSVLGVLEEGSCDASFSASSSPCAISSGPSLFVHGKSWFSFATPSEKQSLLQLVFEL
jgi:hypothetical protein